VCGKLFCFGAKEMEKEKKKGSRNKYKKNRRDAVQAVPSLIVPRSQLNANAVRTFYLNLCNLFNRVNNRVYVGSVRS